MAQMWFYTGLSSPGQPEGGRRAASVTVTIAVVCTAIAPGNDACCSSVIASTNGSLHLRAHACMHTVAVHSARIIRWFPLGPLFMIIFFFACGVTVSVSDNHLTPGVWMSGGTRATILSLAVSVVHWQVIPRARYSQEVARSWMAQRRLTALSGARAIILSLSEVFMQ